MTRHTYDSKMYRYDSKLAVAYMTYLTHIRDEDMLEIAAFMESLPDFKGMTLLLDEAGFELLCRQYARKHPDAYTMVKDGDVNPRLRDVIESEWESWKSQLEAKRDQYRQTEYRRTTPSYNRYDQEMYRETPPACNRYEKEMYQDTPLRSGYPRALVY